GDPRREIPVMRFDLVVEYPGEWLVSVHASGLWEPVFRQPLDGTNLLRKGKHVFVDLPIVELGVPNGGRRFVIEHRRRFLWRELPPREAYVTNNFPFSKR